MNFLIPGSHCAAWLHAEEQGATARLQVSNSTRALSARALGRAGAGAGHEAVGDAWNTVSVSAEPVIRPVMENAGLVNLVLL